jgi:hypothetical protein
LNSESLSYKNIDSLFAFLDESGGYGFDFDKDGVTSHFIITAIIGEPDKIEVIRKKVEQVKKKHFQTGEMKSQLVAGNDIRRIKILQDLKGIDFKIFCFYCR